MLPAELVCRGVLNCSKLLGHCDFVLLPSDVALNADVRANATAAGK